MVTRDSEQYLRFKREHTLPSHEAIMDWYRGTGMRPYLQALDDAGRKKFEAEVFSQVREEYAPHSRTAASSSPSRVSSSSRLGRSSSDSCTGRRDLFPAPPAVG